MSSNSALARRNLSLELLVFDFQSANSLAQEIGSAHRTHSRARFGGLDQCFCLRTGNGTSRMVNHRKPETTVSRAVHTHHCSLVTQVQAVPHMTVGNPRIAGAGVRNRSPGQIAIINQAPTLLQGLHDLLCQNGLRDLLHDFGDLIGFCLTYSSQGSAHPAVICPSGLQPGFGNGLILIDGMGGSAQFLEMLQSSQDGDEKLQNFGLRTMFYLLLMQQDRFYRLESGRYSGQIVPRQPAWRDG